MDLSNDTIIKMALTLVSLGATYLISVMVIKVLKLENKLIAFIALSKKEILEEEDKKLRELKNDIQDKVDREVEHLKDLIRRNGHK